jgi:signal transduction histidine kinase
MILQAEMVPPGPPPDFRLLFVVSLVVVASVVMFTGGVIFTLLRRSDRRRAEEEKLAAMGTATARILHQIKNPLQTIVLHSDILQNDAMVADPVHRREVADAIIGESQRLVAMLEELSVYASGAQRALNRQPLAVDEMVRQVAARETGEAAEGVLQVEAPRTERAVVFADAYYLRQALDNLVRNAREAMEGQADARLVLAVERAPGEAVVRIADNGPGIPADRLERVFQPFVSTKGKGMGLGLAICREIVEAHAGHLEVDSVEGRGTTFVLRLPLHDGSAPTALPGLAPETATGTAWS